MTAILTTALAAGDVDPALLKALGDHDDRMEKHLDTHTLRIDAVVRDLDGSGKVKSTTTSKLEQTRVGGKLKTKVLAATKDGADNLEDEKKRAAEADEKNERTESPFAPRNQGKYRFRRIGPTDTGLLMIGFEPKGARVPEVLEGIAYVDEKAGEVVKQVMTPSKLPMFADEVKMELEYETQTEAGRAVSKFVLAGAGGVLFVKRKGDLTMRFTFE
ncbi:MAG: hypothetical protein JNK82_34255 [Myxococcaceae bacterium]|nr:hypothetical protein [Myxococcaceae bacterium]